MYKVCSRLALHLVLISASLASAQSSPQPQPAGGTTSQVPANGAASEKAKTGIPEDAFVIEQSIANVTYEADGTGSRESINRIRIQSDAGLQRFGVLVFSYQQAFEKVEVAYVRVRKPDGKVIDTPLETIQDIDSEITRSAPYYSDFREKHAVVRGLAVGDVLEWKATFRVLKPRVPGQFWLAYEFNHHFVTLDEQFHVSVPRDVYLKVKSPKLAPKVREESGRRLYEWQHAQLKDEEDLKEKFRPPFLQPQPDVQISTFRSWDELGRWYESLQKDRVAPTPEIRAKAAELTKNAKTDEEKIRAIYDYVATNFRYVGVAFGIGAYQPHSADDVLANSYGDCKDKHTLLASLLEAAGIEASPALISSVHALDPDVPSPAQFDHVITAVRKQNSSKDLLWLDATSEVAPFGQLLINLRDKQALVIPRDAPATLIKTPAEPAVAASEQLHIRGILADSGELQATIEHQLRGDPEVFVRSAFRRVPQSQWKELIQNLSYVLGYAGLVSDISASSPTRTAEPFRFAYKYDRKEYSEWANKRITAPLPPVHLQSLSDEHERSGEPLPLDAPQEIAYIADIQLPSGYTPRLPENIDLKSDFAEYHSKYSLENGLFHAERHLIIKQKQISTSQYSAYRDFTRKVSDDEGAWILFTATNASAQSNSATSTASATAAGSTGAANASTWPSPPNTQAGLLYRQGASLAKVQKYGEAMEKFQEAAKLDPKLPGVWSAIGQAFMKQNETAEGIEAMRRQIKETPDLVPAYKLLGYTLLSLHRPLEAIPVCREGLRLAPADHDLPAYLGNALLATKQYYDAVEQLEAAVRFNPKSANLQVQLGNAYLGTGNHDKAYETFAEAVELDSTYSGARNDAAYALADNGVHLLEASTWAQQAVDDKEDETRTIDLERLDPKDLRAMNQLSAYWDTLGWIHFRNAQYETAEQYLLAAWWLRQDTTVGHHLGQLYEKLHNSRKAVRFYSLAVACPDARDKTPSREALVRLFTAGATADSRRDARAELGEMRTIRLPRLTQKHATAEFFVLLTNNGEARPRANDKTAQNSSSANNAAGAKQLLPAADRLPSERPNERVAVEQVKFLSGAEELRNGGDLLRKANFGIHFPDPTLTKVVRRGILVCEPGHSGCEFVLMSAESVSTVN